MVAVAGPAAIEASSLRVRSASKYFAAVNGAAVADSLWTRCRSSFRLGSSYQSWVLAAAEVHFAASHRRPYSSNRRRGLAGTSQSQRQAQSGASSFKIDLFRGSQCDATSKPPVARGYRNKNAVRSMNSCAW
jgi:hypothetical protein